MTGVDWQAVEQAAVEQVVAAVRQVRAAHPDEHVYGAMFHEFYGDGEELYWPCVTVGTEESLARAAASYRERWPGQADPAEALRWSGPDLEHTTDPGRVEDAWAERCLDEADAASGRDGWHRVYQRLLQVFPQAARTARAELVREGVVDHDFVAVAADESGDLIPLSLTASQLERHFPHYGAASRERSRLAALPVAERVAEVVPQAVRTAPPGPLTGEYAELVRELGIAAVPALVEVVRGESTRSRVSAIILLAEIHEPTPEVVAVLEATLDDQRGDLNARTWAAAALARLGRTDLVVPRIGTVPDEVVARGIAAPYRSFRDRGRHGVLDYAPLEDVLAAHPELESALTEELRPGVGFCALDAEEVAVAEVALGSAWAVVRDHARTVLEDARR